HPLEDIEGFALSLGRHFIDTYSHVSATTVSIHQPLWQRITAGGAAHPHAFESAGGEKNGCIARVLRDVTGLEGGIEDLVILKTTNSAFTGYIKDRFTTLKETADRVFATSLSANWTCRRIGADWNACRVSIRRALLETFAAHQSLSVQQTLYDMGRAALAACDEIQDISLRMPNQHRLLVNLEPFGLDNPNVIFVPTDEPYGLIEGTVARE